MAQALDKPDLAALWKAHCMHEFERKDADATMATMVRFFRLPCASCEREMRVISMGL